jgi:ADP-heptose:LPS heptosyltransferase
MKKRIRNATVVILSLFFSLLRSRIKCNASKRFIIIQPTNNLGDMVCITPIFRAIKLHDPEAHVAIAGKPNNRDLLEHHPYVDEYINIPDSIWKLIKIIDKQRFDSGIAVNFDPIHISVFLLGNVNKISCFELDSEYKKLEPASYRLISRFAHKTRYFPGQYIPEQYLRLLEPFGIKTTESRKTLSSSSDAHEKVNNALELINIKREEKVVTIAPGAGSEYKCWPANRFAEIANHLSTTYHTPLCIVGGPRDQHVIREMKKHLNKDVRYWDPGPQSIDELKATVARSFIVIGNDSGVIHIGEALNVMTLAVVGATDYREHLKETDNNKIVKVKDIRAKYQSYIVDESKIDPFVAKTQMENVTTDNVIKILRGLIKTNL